MIKRIRIDGSLGDGGKSTSAFGPMHPDAAPCVRDLMATIQDTPDLPQRISTLVLQTYTAKHGKTLHVDRKDDDNGCPLPLGDSGVESGVDE